MSDRALLRLASLAFTVLWTSFMWWWNQPLDGAQLVMLAVCGVLCGFGWHFGYGRWFRIYLRQTRKAARS
jgi:hypothetical protein